MKKTTLHALYNNGIQIAKGEENWLQTVLFQDGDNIKISVEKISLKNMEIMKQRRYYRGFIIKILAHYCGYTGDEMHQLLQKKFLSYDKTGSSGKVQTLVRSTSDGSLDTKEFSEYIEKGLGTMREMNLKVFTPDEIKENPQILKDHYPEVFGKKPLTYTEFDNLMKL